MCDEIFSERSVPEFNIQLTSDRPMAINVMVHQKTFDPDYIASLLSSQNKDDDSLITIIMDTGASISTTFDENDFFFRLYHLIII